MSRMSLFRCVAYIYNKSFSRSNLMIIRQSNRYSNLLNKMQHSHLDEKIMNCRFEWIKLGLQFPKTSHTLNTYVYVQMYTLRDILNFVRTDNSSYKKHINVSIYTIEDLGYRNMQRTYATIELQTMLLITNTPRTQTGSYSLMSAIYKKMARNKLTLSIIWICDLIL